MENRSGIFRKKRICFTQVSNSALRDNELSLKAKGLYCLIQSYITMENFTLYKSYLKKQCKEKEVAFESTWKELKESGYLIQYRLQEPKTKHFYYEYELLDEKDVALTKKIHGLQNRKKHIEKSHTPKNIGMEKIQKAIPHKKNVTDKKSDGKEGAYNNIGFNNTDFNNITTSSSRENLLQIFNNNICDLKKITTLKFLEYTNTYNYDFILTVIDYCSEINIKSFAGFKKVIDSYITKNILTKEDLLLDIEKFRQAKKTKYKNNKKEYKNKKEDTFNNYPQRKYDFEKLELGLLGLAEYNSEEYILQENNINISNEN